MRTVPIPGQILDDSLILGLTFDELVLMGSAPLVVTLPSLFIEQIPTVVSLAIAVLVALGMAAVAIRTPEGQSPISWAPAAFKRRIGTNTYYLRPAETGYDRSTYLSVRHTDDSTGRNSGD